MPDKVLSASSRESTSLCRRGLSKRMLPDRSPSLRVLIPRAVNEARTLTDVSTDYGEAMSRFLPDFRALLGLIERP